MKFPAILISAAAVTAPLSAWAHSTLPVDYSALPHPAWIIGTWALCEDPDYGAKDYLRFDADGKGYNLSPGSEHTFRYGVSGLRVLGEPVPVMVNTTFQLGASAWTVSLDRQRLTYTGYGSEHAPVYVRQGTEKALHCSAQ